jgi:NADH-quinone oxidoreductase subunit C
MDSTAIIDVLSRELPGGASGIDAVSTGDNMPTLVVPRERLVETCQVLRDAPDLRFAVLMDIVGVDYMPREPRFEMVYLLLCPGVAGFGAGQKRLRLLVRAPGDDPRVPTVSGIWAAANWAERELYDLFGIQIDGHPDLRRILMPDDWEGHPMRRDYPVQIKDPVKTYSALQLSEEEFVANLEAARAQPQDE